MGHLRRCLCLRVRRDCEVVVVEVGRVDPPYPYHLFCRFVGVHSIERRLYSSLRLLELRVRVWVRV